MEGQREPLRGSILDADFRRRLVEASYEEPDEKMLEVRLDKTLDDWEVVYEGCTARCGGWAYEDLKRFMRADHGPHNLN